MACLKCRVRGRVQGVFFRVATRDQAQSLGVRGFVCNLPDGDVEVVVAGSQAGIEALVDWLHHGPEHAQVRAVHQAACSEELIATLPDNFIIR